MDTPYTPSSNSASGMEDSMADGNSEDREIPLVTSFGPGGLSRLETDFEVLASLGVGAFGDVLKVKNRLDSKLYAIKRITLNPRSEGFGKKIKREVTLLSRLNHEHIVRYYTSWIENSNDEVDSDYSTATTPTANSLTLHVTDLDIDVCGSDSDDSDSDKSGKYDIDEGDHGEIDTVGDVSDMLDITDSSDEIVFEEPSEIASTSGKFLTGVESFRERRSPRFPENVYKQYLYIQMECCEKKTLRECIDANLYEDESRVWRLFGEMCEGLAHIHDQKMIHRDLKPLNIFLDSLDHVKIGDFGLAIANVSKDFGLTLQETGQTKSSPYTPSYGWISEASYGTLTGNVGTFLYCSPEIMTDSHTAVYDQMSYRPIRTETERFSIFTAIKQKDVILPEDFEGKIQVKAIKLLLTYAPEDRPTLREFMQSDILPPQRMEDREVAKVIRSAISNTQGTAYHSMIREILAQPANPMDFTYDKETTRTSEQTSFLRNQIQDVLTRIFQRHRAKGIPTPILLPKCHLQDGDNQQVLLMDHGGGVVGLQYDHKLSFARYVAQNNIVELKRYSMEHIYRETKPYGVHPKRFMECAFDIISATESLMPDAEVLCVVQELINAIPTLQKWNSYVLINHTKLIQAILLQCGIGDDRHACFLSHLRSTKNKTHTLISDHQIRVDLGNLLQSLLNTEASFEYVERKLRSCISVDKAVELMEEGLREMKEFLDHVDAFGMDLDMAVALGLNLNIQHCSGVIFEVRSRVRWKTGEVKDVWATGGRYDQLVAKFREDSVMSSPRTSVVQRIVGINISFEKIVSLMRYRNQFPSASDVHVQVCAVGSRPMHHELVLLVKELWSAELRAEVVYDTIPTKTEVNAAISRARKQQISHIVVLRDDAPQTVEVIPLGMQSSNATDVPMVELANYLLGEQNARKRQESDQWKRTSTQQKHSQTCQSPDYITLGQSLALATNHESTDEEVVTGIQQIVCLIRRIQEEAQDTARNNQDCIFDPQTVRTLITVKGRFGENEHIVSKCIEALGEIALGQENGQVDILNNKGVDHILNILKCGSISADLQEQGFVALANICYDRDGCKSHIQQLGGVQLALDIILSRMNDYPPTVEKAFNLLKGLCIHMPDIKVEIVEKHGIACAISAMKKHRDCEEIQINCCAFLTCLCYQQTTNFKAASKREVVDLVLIALENFPSSLRVQCRGFEALQVLGFKCRKTIRQIFDKNAIDLGMTALKNHSNQTEVFVSVCKALGTISVKSPDIANSIIGIGMLKLGISFAENHAENAGVQARFCTLIRQLSDNLPTSQTHFAKDSLVEYIHCVIHKHTNDKACFQSASNALTAVTSLNTT